MSDLTVGREQAIDPVREAAREILDWPSPSFDEESLLARLARIEGALRAALAAEPEPPSVQATDESVRRADRDGLRGDE